MSVDHVQQSSASDIIGTLSACISVQPLPAPDCTVHLRVRWLAGTRKSGSLVSEERRLRKLNSFNRTSFVRSITVLSDPPAHIVWKAFRCISRDISRVGYSQMKSDATQPLFGLWPSRLNFCYFLRCFSNPNLSNKLDHAIIGSASSRQLQTAIELRKVHAWPD